MSSAGFPVFWCRVGGRSSSNFLAGSAEHLHASRVMRCLFVDGLLDVANRPPKQKDPTNHGFWNPPCLGSQK